MQALRGGGLHEPEEKEPLSTRSQARDSSVIISAWVDRLSPEPFLLALLRSTYAACGSLPPNPSGSLTCRPLPGRVGPKAELQEDPKGASRQSVQ